MTHGRIRALSPAHFHDICVPVIAVPFRSRLCFADNDVMFVHVLELCVMVRSVSVSWHARSGTRCHLISRTLVSVLNSSSLALRIASLCKPTHRRRLWGLLFKRCFTNASFDWLIDWFIHSLFDSLPPSVAKLYTNCFTILFLYMCNVSVKISFEFTWLCYGSRGIILSEYSEVLYVCSKMLLLKCKQDSHVTDHSASIWCRRVILSHPVTVCAVSLYCFVLLVLPQSPTLSLWYRLINLPNWF